MSKKFEDVTVSFDGTHRLWFQSEDRPENDWSYKLKDFGYNVLVILISYSINFIQFVGLTNGWWIYCGNPHGASDNDITLIQESYLEICQILSKNDLFISNRIFVHAIEKELQEKNIPILSGWRKKKKKDLPDWKKRENSELSEQRDK